MTLPGLSPLKISHKDKGRMTVTILPGQTPPAHPSSSLHNQPSRTIPSSTAPESIVANTADFVYAASSTTSSKETTYLSRPPSAIEISNMDVNGEVSAAPDNIPNDSKQFLQSPKSAIIHLRSDARQPNIYVTPAAIDFVPGSRLEDMPTDSSFNKPLTSVKETMLHPPPQPTPTISLQARISLSSISASPQPISQRRHVPSRDPLPEYRTPGVSLTGSNPRYIRTTSTSYAPSPFPPPQRPLPPLPPPPLPSKSSAASPPPHPYNNEAANTSEDTLSPQRETQRYPNETDTEYFLRLDRIFKERLAAHPVYSQPIYHMRAGNTAYLSMPNLTENEQSQPTNNSLATQPPDVAREHESLLQQAKDATSSLKKSASGLNPLNVLYRARQRKSEKEEFKSRHELNKTGESHDVRKSSQQSRVRKLNV
ncbi:hypothetical protein M422DRAFT_773983 [Sphaerobolus stellatus SS14]|nr:hypothetical protein M422DRAFT_773983 [Sphaerobolus stellatus SS14]